MDTVNFECGHCAKEMAVEVGDLGKEVPCPHCGHVVQAPPASPPPPPPTPAAAPAPFPELHIPSPKEQESIFSPTDETASDDLFGALPAPLVEVPAVQPPLPQLQLQLQLDVAAAPPPPSDMTAPYLEVPAPLPPDFISHAATVDMAPAVPIQPAEDSTQAAETAIPSPTPPRRPESTGVLGTLLLIFLIPYALAATGAIAWMLYLQRTAAAPFNPLEQLPDSKPGAGAPKRVKFDAPLPEKLKTTLDPKSPKPLRIGDIEVTPLRVERAEEGGRQLLTLSLKLVNASQDLAFDPLPQGFLDYQPISQADLKPYTFLRFGDETAYGGYVEPVKSPKRDAKHPFTGVLLPGEEATVRLRTHPRNTGAIERLDRFKGPVVWRVQVRRGFVKVKDRDVSATAVIGVRIDPANIPRPPAVDARLSPHPRPGPHGRRAWPLPPLQTATNGQISEIFVKRAEK